MNTTISKRLSFLFTTAISVAAFSMFVGCSGDDENDPSSSVTPILSLEPVTNISSTSATSGGNFIETGVLNILQKGLVWSTDENPDLDNSFTTEGPGAEAFTSDLTGLLPSTTYNVRAYAVTEEDTVYSSAIQFVTAESASACNRSPGELLDFTGDFAFDDQGNLWFAKDYKFYTLSPDGIETEIAGTGEFSLEDGEFRGAEHLTWHPDGYMLFVDLANSAEFESSIRKVTPDGDITTLTQVSEYVRMMAISKSKKILFVQGMDDIEREKIYELLADNSSQLYHDQKEIVTDITFDEDDRLLFSTFNSIYQLNSDLSTQLIAGSSSETEEGFQYSFNDGISSFATAPQNVMYVTTAFGNNVLRIADNKVEVFADEENDLITSPNAVAVSPNGDQIYVKIALQKVYRFTCE